MAKTTRKPKDEAPSKPAATAAAQPAASGAQQQQAQQPQLVEGQLAGVQLQDGTVVSFGELPEVELRQMAIDMEIVGADTLTIEQLIAAIEAEKVLVEESAGTIDDAQPARIAGDGSRYVVRRERLDHNGESYALGDVIQFDDDEHALQLLAVGAIAPEVV